MKEQILDSDGVFTGFTIEDGALHCYALHALDYLNATKGVASKAALRMAIESMARELGVEAIDVD